MDWAVRVAVGPDDRLKVDRLAEYLAHETAARSRLAPAVVYSDPPAGVMVCQWIDTPSGGAGLFDSDAGLRRIGDALRRLHGVPLPAGLREVNAYAAAQAYLPDPKVGSGPIPRALYPRLLASCGPEDAPCAPRFCHNDLHGGNVLDDGQLWLLDWEYAGAGDPRFDLAGVVAYHDLDRTATESLLQGYGEYSASDLDRWVFLFDIVRSLWMDVADAWHTLPEPRRRALLARLGR